MAVGFVEVTYPQYFTATYLCRL